MNLRKIKTIILQEAEVKLKALVKAMINTDRIAIVRRVYAKNTRVMIGTLAPDEEKQV